MKASKHGRAWPVACRPGPKQGCRGWLHAAPGHVSSITNVQFSTLLQVLLLYPHWLLLKISVLHSLPFKIRVVSCLKHAAVHRLQQGRMTYARAGGATSSDAVVQNRLPVAHACSAPVGPLDGIIRKRCLQVATLLHHITHHQAPLIARSSQGLNMGCQTLHK